MLEGEALRDCLTSDDDWPFLAFKLPDCGSSGQFLIGTDWIGTGLLPESALSGGNWTHRDGTEAETSQVPAYTRTMSAQGAARGAQVAAVKQSKDNVDPNELS